MTPSNVLIVQQSGKAVHIAEIEATVAKNVTRHIFSKAEGMSHVYPAATGFSIAYSAAIRRHATLKNQDHCSNCLER